MSRAPLDIIAPVVMYCAMLWWLSRRMSWTRLLAVGAYARRWLGFKGIRQPKFQHLDRWFAELASRPAFALHLGGAMS